MVAAIEVLAIIPARGGSKGLLHKNIIPFVGYPLIAYSIVAAIQAELVTRVIVSTDDEQIAAVAREYGAEVPFMRPESLAQDHTLDLPVFEHALTWLAENEGYHPEVIIQLRPTSPVRPLTLVDDAVRLLLNNPDADSVRGIVPAGQNPHKMWRIDTESGTMRSLLDVEGVAEPYNAPRQVLPQTYWQTGHIDALRPSTVLKKSSMSGEIILPLMIDDAYTVDIDTLSNLQQAEWKVQNSKLEMVTPGNPHRPLPDRVDLVVFDFDGVMTDNRVWVDETGRETVAANRSDSMGISMLRESGIDSVVISKEVNPVVTARCNKMKVPVMQGIDDKAGVLSSYLDEKGINPRNVIFVGNDINDVPCFPIVGCAVAVADAQPVALRSADLVLKQRGGHGAVRELCDLLIARS